MLCGSEERSVSNETILMKTNWSEYEILKLGTYLHKKFFTWKLLKQRHDFADKVLYSQGYDFSISNACM